MEEQIRKIWNNRYVLAGHVIVNLCVLFCCFTYLFTEDAFVFAKNIVCIVFGILCIILDSINYKGENAFLTHGKTGIIYYTVRPLFAVVMYYMATTKLEGNIFLMWLILTMAELLFYAAMSRQTWRIMIYIFFIIGYALTSVIMLVSLVQNQGSRVTLGIGVREIAFVIVTVLLVLFIGEAIAFVWTYLEKQILKQNRTLEDFNEANKALQEQQERVKSVNEKLGVQKIELQAANARINRSHDEISVQNEIATIIISSVEKEKMLNQIVDTMRIRLDMDVVAVIMEADNDLLVPGEKKPERFVAMSTCLGETFERNLLDSVYGTDLNTILSMQKTYVQNTTTESVKLFDCLTKEQELASVICLPVMNKEECLGTLLVAKNRINVFMDGRAFYENIAGQISIGIVNRRLYEKMNDMAIRDGLTRIYNRRYLTEQLGCYLTEAMAKKIPVSLTLFDIDKFKMVNDTYGHQCGDEVIRYVATLLNQVAIQYGGIAGRYGGEEFVVAFLGKDLETTYKIIEEVYEHIRSKEVVYEDKKIRVRVSSGIASYPATCSNPSELLTRADWAMYHSKQNGRDQITVDSDKIASQM